MSAKAGSPRIPSRALHRLVPPPSVANLGQGREVLSSPKPYTVTLRASIYFLFQKGYYLSGGKWQSWHQTARNKTQDCSLRRRNPGGGPRCLLSRGHLFPTDMAAMSEEVKCAADSRGGHDPALEGCCRTGNHLPCAGMEEECSSVV